MKYKLKFKATDSWNNPNDGLDSGRDVLPAKLCDWLDSAGWGNESVNVNTNGRIKVIYRKRDTGYQMYFLVRLEKESSDKITVWKKNDPSVGNKIIPFRRDELQALYESGAKLSINQTKTTKENVEYWF